MSNKINVIAKSTVGLGNDSNVELEPSETVRQAIERIATIQAQDPNSISLSHNGRILDENSLIKDCSIKNGDLIYATPKNPIGGKSCITGRRSFIPSSDFRKRISNEALKIKTDKIPLYPVTPIFWRGTLVGRGRWNGSYNISIQIPERYPYVAPIPRLETPLYPKHPNISYDGNVCLNILSYDWRPQYTLITVYKSLQWLLENPHYHEWDMPQYERKSSAPKVDDALLNSTSFDSIVEKLFGKTAFKFRELL